MAINGKEKIALENELHIIENWIPKNSLERIVPAKNTLWNLIDEFTEYKETLEGYIFNIF